MHKLLLLALLLTSGACAAPQPIIDMHRHASWPWGDDAAELTRNVRRMDAQNVVLAALSISEPDDLDTWVSAAPGRFLAGARLPCPRNLADPRYNCFPDTEGWVDIDWLQAQVEAGHVQLLHEVALNYYGIRPDNLRMRPYWALAAKYDLPVGVHTGRGPSKNAKASSRGTNPNCCPDYDKEMGNPALLRPILERHPNLRIWLQHVGSGRGDHSYHWDEALALMRDYPNVYAELSMTNSRMSLDEYAAALRRLIDAGFADRILFGSDNQPLDLILQRFRSLDFLSDEQRSTILYDNAARFLKLDRATIDRHYGR